MTRKRKRKKLPIVVPRSSELAQAAQEDPTRFRQRTVLPKKGKGHKERPPQGNRIKKEKGEEKDPII